MTRKSTPSLADAMKAGLQNRPGGRLQSMLGQEAPKPIAVPLANDAYEVNIEHLRPDPKQPRQIFDEEELANLAASIQTNGILQPLIVYQPHGDPENYLIIAGERRWRAARRAGLATVPCLVMGPNFDAGLIDQVQLVENIQRPDLEPLEAARALDAFITQHSISGRDAARRLGKPKVWVSELLGILSIPEQLLERGKTLPKSALIEVSRVKDPHEQAEILERLLSSDAPVRDAQVARKKREPMERVVYYREVFALEGDEPLEIRWKKHPDEVDPVRLAEQLGVVVRELIARAGHR